VTRYVLDGLGFEPRWRQDFSHHPDTKDTGSFSGVKRPGLGVEHSPPSNAELKEKVELDVYFLSVPV
jgi:hypothetical protein